MLFLPTFGEGDTGLDVPACALHCTMETIGSSGDEEPSGNSRE